MVDFFNKEIVAETNLPKRQPDLTTSSLSLTLYESDPELEQVSLEPPPPQPLEYLLINYSLREKLVQAGQNEAFSSWEALSIYHAPKYIRDVDETAFTPRIVSLGPYHRGLQHLHEMDGHKVRALYRTLNRTGQDVNLYLNVVRSLKDRSRACYEAPLSISAKAFVESLVLDSIFMIEIFRGAKEGFSSLGYAPNDPIFTNSGPMHSLLGDMLKFENQLPLFVLDCIYALQFGLEPSSSGHVTSLALNFFYHVSRPYVFYHSDTFYSDLLRVTGRSEALHFLEVFYHSFLEVPKITYEQQVAPGWQATVPCVTDLRAARIKFRVRESPQFWDIQFKDGILHIPYLLIHDGTKSLFLNLIAFEQCPAKSRNPITSYVSFMTNLMNTEVDVGYLHSERIIGNRLGNDVKVANLFNQLGQAVRLGVYDSYFSKLSREVNHHCDRYRRWNALRASFIHKYLSNPWTFISLVGAVILLLLTSAQTFYTIYGYYKPIR